jgi:hypothetical protein
MNRKMAGAALTIAVAAGGCGTTAKPLTSAELTAKGNAICRRVNAEVDRLMPALGAAMKASDQAGVARSFQQTISVEKGGVNDLAGLVPPASLRLTYHRYMDVQKARIAAQERQAEFLAKKRPIPQSNFQQQASLAHKGFALREALGLGDCVRY